MKKQLIGEVDGYKVYVVDGNEIRNKENCEFTNFGQHGRFPFIPVNEVWLDKEHGRSEKEAFVAHAIKESDAMKQGKSYDEAYDLGLGEESKYRERSRRNVYKKLIQNIGDIKVWLVDGKAVRNGYDKSFVEGGHCKVYRFIPKDEIWIDDDLSEQERKPVILHEYNELSLMRRGMPYNKAHLRSNIKENRFRKLFRRNKYPSLKVVS